MRDWYDAPNLDQIFDEQRTFLPRGPLGTLLPPEIEITADRPAEAIALLDSYFAGKIGTMEFATEIERIRLKTMTTASL